MTETTVTCPAGRITGTDDGQVRRFNSIPYSTIPGNFYDAGPRPETTELIDATVARPAAIALSITTPTAARPLSDLPVIVYIHGGRYEHGSHVDPRADGTANALHNVITVQIGYRVGLPGFMRFHDDPDSHYRGIHDCDLALEWVQRNIESFGGDPTNVTVVGQSAGATTALWLARTDHYRGAFRRVLAASPAYPRASYQQRKWLLRLTTGLPLTREHMSRAKPTRWQRGYQQFRNLLALDIALGPHPLDGAALSEVPIVVSSMRDEFYHMAGAAHLDKAGLGGVGARLLGRAMGIRNVGDFIAAARAIDPDHITGRLVGDASNRRWVDQVADESPHDVWMIEFIGDANHPAEHCCELRPLFGLTESPLHDWLLDFARTGETGFAPYGAERTALRVNLADGASDVVKDPLGYVRSAVHPSAPPPATG